MTNKFKKIDKKYVLSDSSVNEYGFRLLTAGYQLDEFRKNPIGYYMHRREDGVVLKWEELTIEGDTITASPVINLCNERGIQTCDEAENGFLNAASVGHIVVLEYSTDAAMMLPGQTGPTITKWYNKECSLVDIPGNCNSLTKLYDAQENEINLLDLNTKNPIMQLPQTISKELYKTLQLADNTADNDVLAAIQNLAAKTTELELENKLLKTDKHTLQQQLADISTAHTHAEVCSLLDRALEDKKITTELHTKLAADYATNPTGLQSLLSAMPAYRSIADTLKSGAHNNPHDEQNWTWNDYEQNDPTGKKLKALKASNPSHYQQLFNEKFSTRAAA